MSKLQRRGFVKLCASAAAAVSANPQALAGPKSVKHYARARLITADGHRPITTSSLEVGRSYVFNYPYAATPCFLIDLGKPTRAASRLRTEEGRSYTWEGGVGPRESIVAFAAICAHRMTHPAKSVSFINYRHQEVEFFDASGKPAHRDGVIYCCSEKSVYDPADGARVLGGPAPQPLAAIMLEYDAAEDAIYALGTCGGEMYDRFFEKFSFRIALESKRTDVQRPIEQSTTVHTIEEYSEALRICG